MTADPDGDAGREKLLGLLAQAAEQGRTIPFWWRDDDAVTATPALDRLLALAGRHSLPLALAVIPRDTTPALAARLAGERRVRVLQHGYAHIRHSPEGEKKAELGAHRPAPEILAELSTGRDRLQALFGAQFLPVLVPPWNRLSDAVSEARASIGLFGLSTYGPPDRPDPLWVNTHVDIFAWKPERRPLTRAEAFALLGREVAARLAGDRSPVGLLTHHLVHTEASWALLEEVLGITGRSPAIAWPPLEELFPLTPAFSDHRAARSS